MIIDTVIINIINIFNGINNITQRLAYPTVKKKEEEKKTLNKANFGSKCMTTGHHVNKALVTSKK